MKRECIRTERGRKRKRQQTKQTQAKVIDETTIDTPQPVYSVPSSDKFVSLSSRLYLFKLLLRAELAGVSALLFAAVGGLGGQPGVALAADGLLAVVLPGQHGQRGIVHAPAQPQHQVQCRFLLNVVIR